MKRKLMALCKKIFWKLPLSSEYKEKLRYSYATNKDRKEESETNSIELAESTFLNDYILDILKIPTEKSEYFEEYIEHDKLISDTVIVAYYLTQYHPTPQNDEWWGKGTTEWTNVSKAVSQFTNQYQPRLPGELGYYDLRLKENLVRQIELANNYGIDVFCFYYYWFDGKRLLEKPLEMFCENKNLNMKFCICWANENWTKRFSGTNADILMQVGDSEESYISFIHDIVDMLQDSRYYTIKGRPVINIYRPSMIVNPESTICRWRQIVMEKIGKEIYLIASQEKGDTVDWCKFGFDAESEFQPKRIITKSKEITSNVNVIRKDFGGAIYDYKDIVENKKYIIKNNLNKKVYHAVMPMWDNTARRNNNALIYHKSTPELYKKWLGDIIRVTKNKSILDKNMIFINAWNEWGEGAYLEPDRYYGYAYLQATREAKELGDSNEKKD